MAKKSKIVKNERRRAIVARYGPRRAELKEIIRSPSSTGDQGRRRNWSWRASRAMPARCGCATAMQSTDVRADICANSGCQGCGSAN